MNALETQTQIVSAAIPLPEEPLRIISPTFDAYLNVCLCDVTAEDMRVFANWAFCKQHDSAVKLASMAERVLLHVKNERGEIVPVGGGA